MDPRGRIGNCVQKEETPELEDHIKRPERVGSSSHIANAEQKGDNSLTGFQRKLFQGIRWWLSVRLPLFGKEWTREGSEASRNDSNVILNIA